MALRRWLVDGRHRAGDRLPPEHDLAAMLDVSRGTLRTALTRLEARGEIVRRQGSGTFVGHIPAPTTLREGLERLESYWLLAKRRRVRLTVEELQISEGEISEDAARALELPLGTRVTTIERLVLADDLPAATMADTVHPSTRLPPEGKLRRRIATGRMLLDVLTDEGLPVAYANTRVLPRLLSPRERTGKLLRIKRQTALLELEEVMHFSSGEPAYYSRDLFAPGQLELNVLRWMRSEAAPTRDVGRRSRQSG